MNSVPAGHFNGMPWWGVAARVSLCAVSMTMVGACDAHTPTGPAAHASSSGPGTQPRAEVSAPTMIGQADVSLPADNATSAGWAPSGITVSGDRWIVVRVEGLVHDTRNDAQCDSLKAGPGVINCPAGGEGDYGPLSAAGSGGVDVALQRGEYEPIPSGGLPAPVLPMYLPRGGDGSVAEALWDVHGTVNVWTHRLMNVSGGGTTFGGSTIQFPAYFLGGGQVVRVLEVPTPVKVSGPTGVTKGDSVTFTAELTGDYTPRTESGTGRPGPFWYFHSNDTTSLPNPATFFEEMDGCRGKMLCRLRADRPGRMYVTEYLEGRQAQNQSEPMRLQQARLGISCRPDTLVAKNATTCTASVTPADPSLTIQSWRFAGYSLGEAFAMQGDVKTWTFRPNGDCYRSSWKRNADCLDTRGGRLQHAATYFGRLRAE